MSDIVLPTQLFIDVAYACNLRCIMCDLFSERSTAAYAPHNGGKPDLMDFDLFKTTIDRSKDIISSYIPQLRGEPFLHPRFLDMLAYLRGRAPSSYVAFNTNGYFMNKHHVDEMLGIGVNCVYISIDAATAETYRQVRLRSEFDRVVANVRYLLEAREKPGLPMRPEVAVSFVLQDINRHEKQDFLATWLGRVERVTFYSKVEFDRSRPIRFFEPANASRVPCQSLWNSLAVLCDGSVVPCCGDLTPLERLGYIQDQDLRAIATGDRLAALRRAHLDHRFDEIELCRGCDTWVAYETRSLPPGEIVRPGALRGEVKVQQTPVSETWSSGNE